MVGAEVLHADAQQGEVRTEQTITASEERFETHEKRQHEFIEQTRRDTSYGKGKRHTTMSTETTAQSHAMSAAEAPTNTSMEQQHN